MKNTAHNIFLLLLSIFCFATSCQKREEIPGVGYGNVTVSSTLTGEPGNLLIQIDDVTKDTLNLEKKATLGTGILVLAGERKFSIVKEEDKSVLYDDIINIAPGKTFAAPRFLYDGVIAMFDDTDAKPEQDSVLIRFINLNEKIADEIDISIYAFNDLTGEKILVKTLEKIGRVDFSEFAQLPDLSKFFTSLEAAGYVIDIIDPSTGNILRQNANLSFLIESGRLIPNLVVSVSIIAGGRGGNTVTPSLVFQRIAE